MDKLSSTSIRSSVSSEYYRSSCRCRDFPFHIICYTFGKNPYIGISSLRDSTNRSRSQEPNAGISQDRVLTARVAYVSLNGFSGSQLGAYDMREETTNKEDKARSLATCHRQASSYTVYIISCAFEARSRCIRKYGSLPSVLSSLQSPYVN
jgi:hypothetical protein